MGPLACVPGRPRDHGCGRGPRLAHGPVRPPATLTGRGHPRLNRSSQQLVEDALYGRRWSTAVSSTSMTSSERMCAARSQPTIRRLTMSCSGSGWKKKETRPGCEARERPRNSRVGARRGRHRAGTPGARGRGGGPLAADTLGCQRALRRLDVGGRRSRCSSAVSRPRDFCTGVIVDSPADVMPSSSSGSCSPLTPHPLIGRHRDGSARLPRTGADELALPDARRLAGCADGSR